MAEQEYQLSVLGVYTSDDEGYNYVLLRDQQQRSFAIGVGPCEAFAISAALESQRMEISRPLTHDLMQSVLERLQAKVEKIVIDDLSHSIFYAKLFIQSNGRSLAIDARPSDAVALALRVDAPIYAVDSVIEQARLETDEGQGA